MKYSGQYDWLTICTAHIIDETWLTASHVICGLEIFNQLLIDVDLFS